MSESPRGSWWATLPGVLTALAGVVTALAGLVGALHQAGVFAMLRPQPQAVVPAPPALPVPAVVGPSRPDGGLPAPSAGLQAQPQEAWRMADGGIGVRLRLRNAGGAAVLVEPARELRLLGEAGAALAPRRATPVFQTLAAGESLEATLEFPPVAGQPVLRLGGVAVALPAIR